MNHQLLGSLTSAQQEWLRKLVGHLRSPAVPTQGLDVLQKTDLGTRGEEMGTWEGERDVGRKEDKRTG